MGEINIKRIVEALLFSSAEPLSAERIAELVGENATPDSVAAAVEELQRDYAAYGLSLKIIEVKMGYLMVTKPQYASWIKKLYTITRNTRLSQSALETLAIIAYKGPLTRVEVDNIRGINSAGVIATLLKRELIKPVGRAEVPGRPILYDVSEKFFTYFGLKSKNELPKLREIEEIVSEANEAS